VNPKHTPEEEKREEEGGCRKNEQRGVWADER